MARNPFEQLRDLVWEPRQTFEDIASSILLATVPDARRVKVFRGDGGIDVGAGNLASEEGIDVYQIKYFPDPWDDSQKRQIRDSFKTASENELYKLRIWTLCVPTRLPLRDWQWFDQWRKEHACEINLIDGDELTERLRDERCGHAREELQKAGVLGIARGGPQLTAHAIVKAMNFEKTGLRAAVVVQIRNGGNQSAKELKAIIQHSETGCLSWDAPSDWKQSSENTGLNPRNLRYSGILNHGDLTTVMGIPVCGATDYPLRLFMTLTAQDTPMKRLSCLVNESDLTPGKVVMLAPIGKAVEETIEHKVKVRPRPSSPQGKQILESIFDHPNPDERGLTHILEGLPHFEMMAAYVPNIKDRGNACLIERGSFTSAIDELVRLGWLARPIVNRGRAIYKLTQEE